MRTGLGSPNLRLSAHLSMARNLYEKLAYSLFFRSWRDWPDEFKLSQLVEKPKSIFAPLIWATAAISTAENLDTSRPRLLAKAPALSV